MSRSARNVVWLCLLGAAAQAAAEEASVSPTAARAAGLKALELVQQAAQRYPEHRQCFSCHHQTLPMLAMVTARNRGLAYDPAILSQQAAFTHKSFEGRIQSLRAGEGIGGRAMTVAYGLWTLALADHAADEVTAAMVTYLLKTQKADGRWSPPSLRPPLEESHVMCTALAAYYIKQYQTEDQEADVKKAVEKARSWLAKAELNVLEDHTARLWGLHWLGGSDEELTAARLSVLKLQQDDGGWAQRDSMTSDAYATAQALFVLQDTGLDVQDAAWQRGAKWLLDHQLPDGSWLVETHSKPVQVYFDNGDPHGKHQFISTSATSWAAAALILAGGK